jgi:hypothetical protein
MPAFTIVSILVTIAITALLTWVLWRINASQLRQDRDGGEGA